MLDREDITSKVRDFYEQLPFNCHSTVAESSRAVLGDPCIAYPDLCGLLESGLIRSVLDIGCGTGVFSLAIARRSSASVLGIDMADAPLRRARRVADHLNLQSRVSFLQTDLFDFPPKQSFDLVVSMGVLHHTFDARAAFHQIQQLVPDRGYIYLGLYHAHGRRAFRALFDELLLKHGEEAALARFASMRNCGDPEQTKSWFRDQVLHPHESWHTLEQVLGWMHDAGFLLRSTSINGFDPGWNSEELIAAESEFEALSVDRNRIQNQFFPGFFTVLGEKVASQQ